MPGSLEQAQALPSGRQHHVLITGSYRSLCARMKNRGKLRMSVELPQTVRVLVIHLKEVFEVLLSVSFN